MQLDAVTSIWALCNTTVSFRLKKNKDPVLMAVPPHGHLPGTRITVPKNLPCPTHCLGCSGAHMCAAEQ